MIKKSFIAFSVPILSIMVVLFISYYCRKCESPLIAAGTVGAAFSAIWAVIYLEIIKPYFDRPKLEIREPGFKPEFYRQAPEKDINGTLISTGYYINILLINTGNRTAKNCQPFLTAMWKLINGNWLQEENWIPVALLWAAGEDVEYIGNIGGSGYVRKPREERNLIPHRPYYFNLGCISTQHPDKLRILQVIKIFAQDSEFEHGKYYFEIAVTGEEVVPCIKYVKVNWDGECTENMDEVKKRFFISMNDNPPN